MDNNLALYFLTIEYNNGREPQELVGTDCHTVKSVAGTVFYYADNVERVTVKNRKGDTFLYLDKTYPDANLNIPSRWAVENPAYT